MGPLADLRDWHLPEALPWWPPAPGWWLLAALGLILLLVLLWRRLQRWRRAAPARRALRDLARLRGGPANAADLRAYAAALSGLLRRLALVRYPRHRVAGLSGPAWLDFLDATGGGTGFREGPGRVLGTLPFSEAASDHAGVDPGALADLVERWIAANRDPDRQREGDRAS